MIKIRIKNKNLNESKDLKYPSGNIIKSIMSFAIASKKNLNPSSDFFEIPLKQIVYSKNEIVMRGLPYLYHYHILNESSYSDIPNLEYSKSILTKSLPLKVVSIFNPKASSMAISGSATVNNNSLFLIRLHLNKIQTGSLENILIHELQHLTQRVNDICLYYGEQLAKTSDPKKMQLTNIQDIPNKFGLGKSKTGLLKTKSDTDVYAATTGDVEYETYLTQIVNSYYKRLMKNKNEIMADLEEIGPEKAAIKYIKQLFNVLIDEPDYSSFKKIINKMIEKRPKELPKDMLSLLTNRLKKM